MRTCLPPNTQIQLRVQIQIHMMSSIRKSGNVGTCLHALVGKWRRYLTACHWKSSIFVPTHRGKCNFFSTRKNLPTSVMVLVLNPWKLLLRSPCIDVWSSSNHQRRYQHTCHMCEVVKVPVCTGCFFNWASPEFAKCWPVSNWFKKKRQSPWLAPLIGKRLSVWRSEYDCNT